MNNTKAIILAAGKGTRMKSDLSKVLHKIFDKTLLGYVLDSVEKTGYVRESYVIVGHQAEAVSEFVQKNYKYAKTILQKPQLGTGHAVSMACPELQDFEGEIVVLCGDTPLLEANTLKKFIKTHREKESDLTVLSAIFENPTNYGRIVRCGDKLDSIVEEKDATQAQKKIQEVNAGVYCLNWAKVKDAFSELKTNNAQGEYYLTDIIKWAVNKGLNTNAYILENNEEIFGINSKTHLAQAMKMLNKRTVQKHLENGVTIMDPDSTWISDETTIESDTVIYPNVFINGKNKIGKGCSIGPFAHIRGGCKIDDGVKIGNFVEVKKSRLGKNSSAGHLTYLGDSELGENVNIGAGTITANYNHFTKVKSNTIIKDGASIGSNTVLVAPLEVGEKANVGAGTVLTKDVKSKALALARASLKVIENWVKD